MVSVRLVIEMASRAVRLADVGSRQSAGAPVVLLVRDELHVGDIHATTRAAEMIDLESRGKWPVCKLPGGGMDIGMSEVISRSTADADHAVATAVIRAEPQPAVIGTSALDASPKTVGDRGLLARSMRSDLVRLACCAQTPTIGTSRCVWWVDMPVPTGRESLRPGLHINYRRTPRGAHRKGVVSWH